jgi:hypothetical protein
MGEETVETGYLCSKRTSAGDLVVVLIAVQNRFN